MEKIYALIKDGVVENTILLDDKNYTEYMKSVEKDHKREYDKSIAKSIKGGGNVKLKKSSIVEILETESVSIGDKYDKKLGKFEKKVESEDVLESAPSAVILKKAVDKVKSIINK